MQIITFRSQDEMALEEGAILRYLGSDKRFDYKDFMVAFEVLGVPLDDSAVPKVVFE